MVSHQRSLEIHQLFEIKYPNRFAENTFACMKAAYDVGINYFDCAEGYSGGESEKVMGQAIKKFGWKRSDIVVSTKLY